MTADETDRVQRVRAYACAVLPRIFVDDKAAIRRLPPGENHDVYAVSPHDAAQHGVVVRVATSERARDCAMAEREAAVLAAVAGVGAPVLHDFRCQSEWFDAPVMCMQLVDGDQRPPADVEDVERLGQTVGSVHALPLDGFAGWPDAGLTLDEYLDATVGRLDARLGWVRDPLPAAVQGRFRNARAQLDEALSRASSGQNTEPLTLLHGDVAGGNMIWTPAPVLIDWEYVRIGDAADEIAYIFNQNGLDAAQRRGFWRGYHVGRGSEPSTELVERVRRWEPVTMLASSLFWVELWCRRAEAGTTGVLDPATPRDEAYYRDQTLQRLGRAESLLAEGRGG